MFPFASMVPVLAAFSANPSLAEKVQPQFVGDSLVGNVGENVPNGFALNSTFVKRQGDSPVQSIDRA